MYLALFTILRFLAARQIGQLGVSDLLVIVVIADAAQNGFSSDYKSITEGIVLVLTIVFWDYLIDLLSMRVPALKFLARAPATPLIVDGKVQWKSLRQNLISIDELRSMLREKGVEDFGDVRRACLEGDGNISVLKR
jgi:uncharacterized membrane protein YcaP (DUF421 family)